MRIFLKTWVAIIMAAFTTTAWGLSISDVLPKAHWSLIALISFIIFAIIIIVGFFDRDRQIEQLKNAQPAIQVVPEKSDSRYLLLVRNIGARAEFKARVEIMDGINHFPNLPTEYPAAWEETRSANDITLNKWDKARLLIATLRKQEPIQETNFTRAPRNLVLFYGYSDKNYTGTLQSISSPCCDSEIKRLVQRTPINPTESDEFPIHATLRIVITSNPSMQEGFSRDYELTVDGLMEIGSHHKEGSRPRHQIKLNKLEGAQNGRQ